MRAIVVKYVPDAAELVEVSEIRFYASSIMLSASGSRRLAPAR